MRISDWSSDVCSSDLFVVYPRNHEAGRSYPAILVTHGSDADERFVDVGFQWDYPVQVWAERGYVVVAMNDPIVGDSEEMLAARSDEHTSELQSLMRISYAVFCLKKKNKRTTNTHNSAES